MIIESIEHLDGYGISLTIHDGEQEVKINLTVNDYGGVIMTDIDDVSENLNDREYNALGDLMSALASLLLS